MASYELWPSIIIDQQEEGWGHSRRNDCGLTVISLTMWARSMSQSWVILRAHIELRLSIGSFFLLLWDLYAKFDRMKNNF